MTELSPLDRALRAARRGHTVAAQRLLDGVLAAEPDNEEATLWRARVAEEPAAKAHFLERALALNPGNRWAADALARLDADAEAPAPAASAAAPVRQERIEHLQCPNCGGQVEVHAELGVKAAVCTHCGSVLDLTGRQLEIIGSTKPRVGPRVPIQPGMEATLEGERHLVIGWLRYKGWDDEDSWRWDEWQLVGDSGTVRYLSHASDEGFVLQTPVHPTPKATKSRIELADGTRIGYSETSPATIEAVRGELTWRPRLGETLRVAEADHEDTAYSVELTSSEVEVVAGPALTDEAVWTAFGRDDLVAKVRAAEAKARRFGRMALPCWIAAVGLLMVGIVAAGIGDTQVDAALTLGRGDAAEVGTFAVAEAGDVVEVDIRATSLADNVWTSPDVYVVGPAGVRRYLYSPDLWTWRGGGESESNRSDGHLFKAPAPGTYRIGLELEESQVPSAAFAVQVRTGVWMARYFVFAAGLSLLLGLLVRVAGGSGKLSY